MFQLHNMDERVMIVSGFSVSNLEVLPTFISLLLITFLYMFLYLKKSIFHCILIAKKASILLVHNNYDM